jgi:hypothetical protein
MQKLQVQSIGNLGLTADYTPTSQVQYIISQLKYSEESTTWSTTPENHLENLTHKTGEN